MKKCILYSLLIICCFNVKASILDSANYYFNISEFKTASSFYEKECKKNNSVSALRKYAKSLELSYEYKKSLEQYLKAKSIAEKNNEDSLYYVLLIDIADLHRSIGDQNRAFEMFYKIKIPLKYIELNARKFHRLAATFNEIGAIDSALIYSKKSIELSKSVNHLDYLATSNNEIANIFEKKGKIDSAKYYYEQACNFWKKDKNLRYYSNGYYNLAHAIFLLGDNKNSIEILKDNLQLINGKGWLTIENQLYSLLCLNCFKIGDSINAYKFQSLSIQKTLEYVEKETDKEFRQLQEQIKLKEKDNLLKEDSLKIASQNIQITTEKQNFQLLLILVFFLFIIIFGVWIFNRRIRKSNVLLTKNNEKLSKLVQENEFLVQESHHRIKNNLQLIITLIQMEVNRKQGEESKKHLENISFKIQSIATLHKQLYVNDDLEDIDMFKFLNDIKDNFFRIIDEGKVNVKLNNSKVYLPMRISVYIGLIVTELINNSLKYAFEDIEDRRIEINFSREGGGYSLLYSDNGIGLPGDKKDGVGMRLIRLLSKQIKGDFDFSNDNGLKYQLYFKVYESSNS